VQEFQKDFLPPAEAEKYLREQYRQSDRFYNDGIAGLIRQRIEKLLSHNFYPDFARGCGSDRWHIARVDEIGVRGVEIEVEEFLRVSEIPYGLIADPDTLFVAYPRHGRRQLFLYEGGFRFRYEGKPFFLFRAPESTERVVWSYVACPDLKALQNFVHAIETYSPARPDGRILAYRGKWLQDTEAIYDEIKGLTWDDLLLDGSMKDDIRHNVESFFAEDSGDIYKALGIPQKRGFLFAGDPGSGKSLTAKIIAATVPRPFIYVTDLDSQRRTDNDVLTEIFQVARRYAPSILCFEDLDSLLSPASRTHFLQLMDGFEGNHGVLTLATTNYPEKIDPALLSRPSRFDRKYAFAPPKAEHRLTYLTNRFGTLKAFGLDIEALAPTLAQAAQKTDEFSVAMLQELVVSSAHSYRAAVGADKDWATIILRAVEDTNNQMKKGKGAKLYEEMTAQKSVGFRR
jgi:hypothetical protein